MRQWGCSSGPSRRFAVSPGIGRSVNSGMFLMPVCCARCAAIRSASSPLEPPVAATSEIIVEPASGVR